MRVIWRILVGVFAGLFHFPRPTLAVPAQFNETYSNTTKSDELSLYQYSVQYGSVVRVRVESNATADYPLLVVVRETRAILSWQIPLILQSKYAYDVVERTLCPLNETASDSGVSIRGGGHQQSLVDPLYRAGQENEKTKMHAVVQSLSGTSSFTVAPPIAHVQPIFPEVLQIDVTSASPEPVAFSVTANLVQDFVIGVNEKRSFHIDPSQPQYVKFTMPHNLDGVNIRIDSEDERCMVASVQSVKCPVFDLDNNVEFSGVYQTITKSGLITIRRQYFVKQSADLDAYAPEFGGSFYIVLVMKPTDVSCGGGAPIVPGPGKKLELVVEPMVSNRVYGIAILVTFSAGLGMYILVVMLSLIFYWSVDVKGALQAERQAVISRIDVESNRAEGNRPETSAYGTVPLNSPTSSPTLPHRRNLNGSLSTDSEDTDLDDDQYDALEDAASDKSVLRAKANLTVADLARKPYRAMNKKYMVYHWNLITIAIFYALPVVQLVFGTQMIAVLTGDQDVCFYNFRCTRPLWRFIAFNNIFSNCGYMMLGFLFLILVYNRDRYHKKVMEEQPILELKYGVPRYYGLFYAMGVALFMEGVLSACYHVCPSYTNFQFDTAFMYMIGCLGILKIFEARHPDINANAHVAYVVMAMWILLAVIGVVYNGLIFWIIFSLLFIILMVSISVEFYYKGRWRINKTFFLNIRHEWASNPSLRWFMPLYPERMIFLVMGNALNLAFIIFGLVMQTKSFNSYLVAIIICNLLFYALYYLVMKIRRREKIGVKPIFYISLSCVTWAASIYFFMEPLKSWQETPAESRTLNRDCILLNFYDSHDIWHFLSATSLFLDFMAMLTIDDDLLYKDRREIASF